MTTGAFNDPSGDGNPLGQRLVVLKIRRVVKEIVGTVVHRLPLCRSHLSERGTAAHAGSHQTGLPTQNFQHAPSRPAICFQLLVWEKGPRRLPHILRHMDKVDDDDQGDVPLLRHLLEMINLRKIAIHPSDPALLSLRIPVCRLVEHLLHHRLRRLRQAGPDPFVFRPWPRGPRFPQRGRIRQDLRSDPGVPPRRTSPASPPPATAPGWPRPVCVQAVAARTPFPAARENPTGSLLACAHRARRYKWQPPRPSVWHGGGDRSPVAPSRSWHAPPQRPAWGRGDP